VEFLAGETSGFTFAKVGLAGCARESSWKLRWERVGQALPCGVLAVPVGYADEQAAQSLELREVLELAVMLPARLMLIDTYNKSGGRLTDHLTFEALAKLSAQANLWGVQLAFAGSLQLIDFERLLALAPAYLGVRGAACIGGRDGAVDVARVKSLAKRIRGFAQNEASRGLTTPSERPILPSR
jgi:(5-formylfuran-3-yl)methyl phosphate synthase